MLTSLRLRLLLMMSLVALVAVGTVYLLAGQGAARAVTSLAADTAARDRRLAASLLEGPLAEGDARRLQLQAERLAQAMEAQIVVADPWGRVLADSAQPWPGPARLPRGIEPGADWPGGLAVGGQGAFVVVQYGPANGWALEPGAPISAPVQDVSDTLNRSLLIAAAAGGGAALALTLFFASRVVKPLEALTAAARRMEKGDLSQRVAVRARDEVGALAHAFNAMADGLARQEQLRRRLVSDVAHELRTPLTNLRGYLEAAHDGMLSLTPELIESLYDETMLLTRLVDDLQELTLAEAGQLRLDRQATPVSELVTRTLTALPPQLTAGGPVIRQALAPDLPLVDGDPERLRQVLRNLLLNALQHTPSDGEVVVAARRDGAQVAVSVRDTGEGIAPEHVPFVFERFYRADPARARVTGGAGLGLAIVRQLVEAHGGQVTVESAPGQGSTFTFTVPVAPGR